MVISESKDKLVKAEIWQMEVQYMRSIVYISESLKSMRYVVRYKNFNSSKTQNLVLNL